MQDPIQKISEATDTLNAYWDDAVLAAAGRLGMRDPLKIMPYRGYGTPDWLYIKGRVLEAEGIETLPEEASAWKNAENMYRRFDSDEVPGAKVKISTSEGEETVVANEEGFFEARIQLTSEATQSELWQSVELELVSPQPRKQEQVTATGEVRIVPPTAKVGVISDIDDTVVYTAASDVTKMVRIAYLGNAHSRKPFTGVEPFYNALQAGTQQEGNPIFYVSSSPWNMYDLFDKFMSINGIPNGPILLRDIELSPANLTSFSHRGHKREQIEPIFSSFPDLPFILIGDSGQKDAEIYQQLVDDYPNRILAIYLRDALPDDSDRRKEVKKIAEEIRSAGVEFVLFTETSTAAQHAHENGWILAETIGETIPDSRV